MKDPPAPGREIPAQGDAFKKIRFFAETGRRILLVWAAAACYNKNIFQGTGPGSRF